MKKQIILSFILIFSIMAIGSAVIVQNLLESTAHLRRLIDLHEIEDIRQNLNLRVQKVQSYVYLSPLDFSYNIDDVIVDIQGLEESAKACNDCHHEPDVAKDIAYTERLIQGFQEKLSYLITARNDTAWRQEAQKQAFNISNAIRHHVQEMVSRAAATLQRKTEKAIQGINRTYPFLVATLLATFLLAILIAQYLTKKITKPTEELLVAARKIASGELGYKTTYKGSAEFKELISTFNSMSSSLADKEAENSALYGDLKEKLNELHQTQDQLLVAEKMASLGKLAGGISHDFNNILCGIIGQISLLKANLEPATEDYETLDSAEKAAYRASKLVDQLQTYANQKNWEMTPVNINNIIVSVVKSFLKPQTSEMQILMHLDENLGLAQGDPTLFKELIKNVCENAVQALDKEGHIEITSENCQLDKNKEGLGHLASGKYIKITIKDNGIGIPEDILPKIFDPYFSTQDRGPQKGMGLGMAIAFSIVSKHDGHIHLESKEGLGTSVYIYLPASN